LRTEPANNNTCEGGSAEDEMNDGATRFAKIRPMRVEMYCIYWN